MDRVKDGDGEDHGGEKYQFQNQDKDQLVYAKQICSYISKERL